MIPWPGLPVSTAASIGPPVMIPVKRVDMTSDVYNRGAPAVLPLKRAADFVKKWTFKSIFHAIIGHKDSVFGSFHYQKYPLMYSN